MNDRIVFISTRFKVISFVAVNYIVASKFDSNMVQRPVYLYIPTPGTDSFNYSIVHSLPFRISKLFSFSCLELFDDLIRNALLLHTFINFLCSLMVAMEEMPSIHPRRRISLRRLIHSM